MQSIILAMLKKQNKDEKRSTMFKIGDKVQWASQAGGSITKKIGVIVALVEEYQYPYVIAMNMFPTHKLMFNGGTRIKKIAKAYLVEVAGKTTNVQKKLYFPKSKNLKAYK